MNFEKHVSPLHMFMLINRLFILFLFGFVVSCTAYHEAQIRKKLEPIEFVDIPSGTFMMGDFYNQKDSDALPLHKVTVKQFAMSKYETTYSQYDTFAKLKNMPLP
ncbi:MAG: SUMF1/EgtB/PvdO family nonheme iron enzyme, partial [Candidatus Marinimicrobia bacterium]|nr:SUMF1/EgtB/PvdO family nonheme iron enzyme [Candidatus Neomarinimicrobiota bacterium]